ncbi:hypothetical protein WUni_008830 [Wolbachia endosymbiont of Muscidifurax uniraptor]|nr:hypothetical protein WUni_008830 [Wolbachia endosymbiont of Muscidifurax uniraptor]
MNNLPQTTVHTRFRHNRKHSIWAAQFKRKFNLLGKQQFLRLFKPHTGWAALSPKFGTQRQLYFYRGGEFWCQPTQKYWGNFNAAALISPFW